MSRVQLWSCGGGRQSAGVAALIVEGKLPRPDHACMVKLEGEIHTTWKYVDAHIRPAIEAMGIPFTVIDRAEYATQDFWGGVDGETILIPVFTNQSGKLSKLPEFCSGEWKRRVVSRWAAEMPGWKDTGVDTWMGITTEESGRRRGPQKKWIQPAYPLLDLLPTSVGGCLVAVERVGWPPPPRSRCYWCPNQHNREWAELTSEEWEAACKLDEEIRETDAHAFLHKRMIPLRQVNVRADESQGELFGGGGGCSSGMCF